MGLHSQLNDIVSSDSIPLLILSIIATFVSRFRSLLPSSTTASYDDSVQFSSFDDDNHDSDDEDDVGDGEEMEPPRYYCWEECVVCLSKMSEGGERIRMLDCRHVFHARCLDGWLRHLNFNCPLCRSPIRADYYKRVRDTRGPWWCWWSNGGVDWSFLIGPSRTRFGDVDVDE